ncbi:MAG: AAA family ATPase [bacterium]|nr:AAA family ATPase [bacterium]
MDLFDFAAEERERRQAPLAARMRPANLEQFIGQEHILGPGRLLRRAILADQLTSLIFYGPPGTGKTTLARIIAGHTQSQFIAINAVLAGIKDIREAIASAETLSKEQGRRSILFIDEVHRFNKAQQDALLPHVERGLLVLVGATTENPYFEVNKALVSRSRIFELKSLEDQHLVAILKQALADEERGFGGRPVEVLPEALLHLAQVASGDARAALNALELAVVSTEPDAQGVTHVDLSIAEESIQRKAVLYDKDGDAHFDVASAFIKSLRGSDPDAALYWMAKMLYAGEDPRFLFRRMIIFASEDVGMADPKALEQVISAARSYDYVGLPEGRFPLAQACIYLATAPKSNSAFAFFDALKSVEKERAGEVPNHLKDASRDADDLGHGKGYLYPHAFRDHWVAQQYLPSGLQGRLFYQPSEIGYEAQIKDQVEARRETQLAAMLAAGKAGTQAWEERSLEGGGELLAQVRHHLFEGIELGREPLTLCLNESSGILLGQLCRLAPLGSHHAQTETDEGAAILRAQFQRGRLEDPQIHSGALPGVLAQLGQGGLSFEWIFALEPDPQNFAELAQLLAPKGQLVFARRLPQQGQRLSAWMSEEFKQSGAGKAFLGLEEELFKDPNNPKMAWDEAKLAEQLNQVGLLPQGAGVQQLEYPVRVTEERLQSWFEPTRPFSYGERLKGLGALESKEITGHLRNMTLGQRLPWKSPWTFFRALKPESDPD